MWTFTASALKATEAEGPGPGLSEKREHGTGQRAAAEGSDFLPTMLNPDLRPSPSPAAARLPRLHPRLPGGDSERREQHSPPLRLPTALGAASHKRRAEAWDRLWDGTRATRVERIRCWVRSQKGQQK